MNVGEALDRLLARLRPDAPVDAGLAELGLMVESDLEALVVRALAIDGPLGRTDLAAFVAASPRPDDLKSGLRAVSAAARRLHRRGLVEGPEGGPYRLSDAVEALTLSFPRLIGRSMADAPALDLAAARTAVSASPPGPLTAEALAAALGGEVEAHRVALDGLSPDGRALAEAIGGTILHPPLRIALDHAMARVAALADAAMGVPVPPDRAFSATWLTFIDDFGAVLDPATLAAQDERRVELVRRWAWFTGCPVRAADGLEPPLVSAAALARVDWRRVQADARTLEVLEQAEAAAAELIEKEKTRRAEAARAYASGRRE